MTQASYSAAIGVTGATGAQIGATAKALLRAGHPVRALTRHPDSSAAQRLQRLGAQVAYADFTDRASLDAALAGATALFAVTTPFETDVEQEVKDGTALLDAAAATGSIEHIVFTSAANADHRHPTLRQQVSRRTAPSHAQHRVDRDRPGRIHGQYAEEWTLQGLREGIFGRPMPADKPLASTVGGHVKQAVVWPTLEVIVTESPAHLRKRVDPETGLALIALES